MDFAAYGDCRSGHEVHRAICASIAEMKPKFVAVSGDLVDWGDDEGDWRIFRSITQELRSKTEYLPAPGNHDGSFAKIFEKEFGLEKSYYDRRMGDVHLFLLDSNESFSDAPQLQWLQEKAAASDAKHKIAVFHHAPFTVEPYGEFLTRMIRDRIHGLLVRLKFCAAFCGHHHAFYATRRDGLRYVVTAGGGAVLYEVDPGKAIPGDVFRKFHHFVGCTMTEKGISARVFEPDGREVPELAFTVCEHP
jgi:3',5'-cyclic AMP phosphodiesterase CpdA